MGWLRGAPIREKLMHYAPVELARQASHGALMFVIAEEEGSYENRDHASKAQTAATGMNGVVTIPGICDCGIYREARQPVQNLAIEWVSEHP